MLHSHVQGLKPPAENTLGAFQQWFEPEHRRTKLRRHSSHMLDDQGEVVALRVPADRDRLTRVVQVYFSWLFIVSPDPHFAQLVFSALTNKIDRNTRWANRLHLRAQDCTSHRGREHSSGCCAARRRNRCTQLHAFPGLAHGTRRHFHGHVRW